VTNLPDQNDPAVERMRLRTQPKPVLRLSRKVLIGGGTVAAIAIGAALAFAMTPQKPKTPADQTAETAPTHTPLASEALNGLPKDYTGVPKLGAPLPGDLGRPMLAAGQTAPAIVPGGGVEPTLPQASATYAAPSQAMPQAEQARAAARSSQLFFAQSSGHSEDVATASPPQAAVPLGTWPIPAPASDPKSDAEKKAAYLERTSDSEITSGARLVDPVSPYTLSTGSVVPAALITGLRSDIPGQVLAQVTQDVRDSLTGRYILIPKGSRLIGQYDNAISFGQSRILLVWSRLILPNGKSLVLDKLSAADARGYAGLADTVDNHWASIVNAAAISTLLGVGAQTGDTQSEADLVRALRDGAADSINRAGQRIVERQLAVQPTLTIRAGMPVRVILSRDLILEPYGD
jgi:type IV secretion system protein VirB10